ncbi:alpha/beta hydrolase [Paenibacillus sp. 7124]|uniref:Alpha/beta hydrolase n=1 Tax=Paenibacillus apii TaxID=1850370 RepID=A0A6M1PKJ4_9BACL|nr:alpha/beta hydrolase [Paenibacillus apii]NGM82483.1 alpha/beta hydrolase [Paenibacillus apii]NJJ39623.1 alpha/beta hydrolase [Paenibacillus apii]
MNYQKKKNEYAELLSLVKEQSVTQFKDGYDFIVKKIPDSDNDGELDPRVLSVLQQHQSEISDDERKSEPSDGRAFEKIALRMRAGMLGSGSEDITDTEVVTSKLVINGTNGTIPIRIYRPGNGEKLPVVVFFHGGAFIGGTVDGAENVCKALSEKADAVVISVDYRLAPEHPFPAGFVDCLDVVNWTWRSAEQLGINRNQITVAGDSAGANLAAACALKDKELGTGMIKYQALIYPVVNNAEAVTDDFSWSIDEYIINRNHEFIMPGIQEIKGNLEIIRQVYAKNLEASIPYISPLLAEQLNDLPEALILTAEYDYLRLEAEAYARKLSRCGVKTRLIQYNGTNHGFLDKLGLYPQAEDCLDEISEGIRRML